LTLYGTTEVVPFPHARAARPSVASKISTSCGFGWNPSRAPQRLPGNKDFGSFKLCGEGRYPKTFLLPGQSARGQKLYDGRGAPTRYISFASPRMTTMPYTRRVQKIIRIVSCLVILVLAGVAGALAQAPDWTEPFPPFRIAGNLYYVGSKGLANYLITTPQGNILINSDLEANVPMIQASIEKLGFKFNDTKILLISHAHFDHDAGSAKIKEMTGARYMVMDADVPVVESGGKLDFQYGDRPEFLYRPTKVDRVLHDGDEVRLGGTVLVAHLTPGHTKGCTTWRMQVTEGGKTYNVVIVGSPNVNPGYKLVNNQSYPQIADDYVRMWAVLKSLPCDIFLGAHGAYFDLEEKYARLKDGGANPFVDPSGYKNYVAEKEQEFNAELAKQKLAER
jgi:metallo-beta-lactamase class B